MVIDAFESANTLVYWLTQLDNLQSNQGVKIEEQFKVGSLLIPCWKNYITTHSDFYDRYPEMVSHGSAHIANMCTLAAELLGPPIRTAVEAGKEEDHIIVNNAELFLLITGIFFHDLGMSAVDQTNHSIAYIRKHHSQLSAQVIDTCFRQRHQLNDYDPNNLFPNASLWEEKDIEIIKRICLHHQSSAPIRELEYHKDEQAEDRQEELEEEALWRDGNKDGSNEELQNMQQKTKDDPKNDFAVKESLESFVETHAVSHSSPSSTDSENRRVKFLGKPVDLLFIASLLRIIDAVDIQYSRLGSALYTTSKIDEIRHKIEEKEKEKNNLLKFIETLQQEDAELHEYLKSQLDRVKEKILFLSSQIPDHFYKHASIEKVWFLPDETVTDDDKVKSFTVVYSLPDDHAKSMFLSKITSSTPVSINRAIHLKEELCKELSAPILSNYTIKQKVELRQKKRNQKCIGVKGQALIGNGLNEILESAGLKINLIPQEFDPHLHKSRINELQQFGPRWNHIPGAPTPVLNDAHYEELIGTRIHESIKYGGGRVYFFLGPEGSGKTTFSRTLANYLLNKQVECLDGTTEVLSICYIPCEGLKKTGENENINYLIKRFVFFLASQGDFLFYNLLRNNPSIDESYWPYLFGKLNKPNYLFIFDDIHVLSRRHDRYVTYRFLRDFFVTLSKITNKKGLATVIGFSQKLPAMLQLDKQNKNPMLLALPHFSEKDMQKAFSKKYVGPKIVRHPELRAPIEKLLRRYQEYPAVLDYIRQEESRITNALQNSPDDINMIMGSAMGTYFKQRVYEKIGTKPSRETIHYLYYYPVTLENYQTLCRFFSNPHRAENEITELLRRALLIHTPEHPLYFAPQFHRFIEELHHIPRKTRWWQDKGILDWFDFLQSKQPLELVRIPDAQAFSVHSQAVFERLRRFFTLDFTDRNTGSHPGLQREEPVKIDMQDENEQGLPTRLPGRPDLLMLAALLYRSSDEEVDEKASEKLMSYAPVDSSLPVSMTDNSFDLSPEEQRYIDFILPACTTVLTFLENSLESEIVTDRRIKTLIQETSLYYTQQIDLGADTTDDLLWLLYAESRLKEDQAKINTVFNLANKIADIKARNPKLTEPKIIDGDKIIEIGTRKGIEWNKENKKQIGTIKKDIKKRVEKQELQNSEEVVRWLENNIETFFK